MIEFQVVNPNREAVDLIMQASYYRTGGATVSRQILAVLGVLYWLAERVTNLENWQRKFEEKQEAVSTRMNLLNALPDDN